MVDRIIRWFVNLLYKHNFVILTRTTYDDILDRPSAAAYSGLYQSVYNKLKKEQNARITELEARVDELEKAQQQAAINRSDEPTPAGLLREWLHGEAEHIE